MPNQLSRQEIADRNTRWVAEFVAGSTITEIASRDGYTRQMVHLIVKRAGLDRLHGGIHRRKNDREAREQQERLDKKALKLAETGKRPGVTKQTLGRTYSARIGYRYLGNFPDLKSANEARLRAELTIDEVSP